MPVLRRHLFALALLPLTLALALALPVQGQPRATLTPADQADLKRLAAYFNDVRSLRGRFLQIAPDGSSSEGLVAMRRPGRFRFEYESPQAGKPGPLLIVSDGSYVTMEDRQLKTVDRLPLTTTPLDILMRDTVSFDDPGLLVLRVERGAALLRVTLADRSKPQDGKIMLIFGDKPLEFAGWTVLDAAGQSTAITLSDLEFNPALPDSLFNYGTRPAQLRELQRRR